MTDLEFISGDFLDYEIPKDKKFLLKYFKSDLQVAFLRYYLLFGEHRNFTDHTGHHCARRSRLRMAVKCRKLTEAHEEAKRSLTEEGMKTLHAIETGKYFLTRKR